MGSQKELDRTEWLNNNNILSTVIPYDAFLWFIKVISWRRKWQPTPVFLPGESHGRRSLVGYSPRGRKESDTTERLHLKISNSLLYHQYPKLSGSYISIRMLGHKWETMWRIICTVYHYLWKKKKMCIYLHMNVCVKHIYLFTVDILCLRKGKLRNWSEWLCSERVPDGWWMRVGGRPSFYFWVL